MPFLVLILVGLVLAVPIAVIILAVRQSDLSGEVRALEKRLRALEATLKKSESSADQRIEAAAPFSSSGLHELGTPASPPALPVLALSSLPAATPPVLPALPMNLLASEAPFPLPQGTSAEQRAGVVDWEKFLGVKLFAWVGGVALFLGIAFFIKYSFEHNLIPPLARVALGFLAGIGLVAGGLLMRRKAYAVTSQTLCATGILTLYASSFAAHAIYHLVSVGPVFLVMTLITAAAFTLAVRLDARAVAVLGLAGGFLTPVVLSTGQDRPLALFGYIALIDIGLAAVALKRRWDFLLVLGAAGTGLTEIGWFFKFFEPAKSYVALAVFAFFCALQSCTFFISARLRRENRPSVIACCIQAAVSIFVAICLTTSNATGANAYPGVVLALIFGGDLMLLAISLRVQSETADPILIQTASGIAAFTALTVWLEFASRDQDLYWALGAVLLFAILHSVFPQIAGRRRTTPHAASGFNLLPVAALVLMLLLLLRAPAVSFLVWPVVFLVNMVLIGLAAVSGSLAVVLGAVLLTALLVVEWIAQIPREAAAGGELLIVGLFGILFFVATLWLSRRAFTDEGRARDGVALMERYLPALSALLPFLLLCQIILRLDLPNPYAVFGISLILSLMLLWLATKERDELYPVALAAVLFTEYFWHLRFGVDHAALGLPWYLLFHAVFMAHPFFFLNKMRDRLFPWITSALAGPAQFYLIYSACKTLFPEAGLMGLLPAALAIPSAVALARTLRVFGTANEQGRRVVALYGGNTLFFITLVYPIQFSHQWLTLGWGLEGVALCWLFTRVAEPGLPLVGVALLVVAFARLALNPEVFTYYARSQIRVFNWYLYTYGIVTVCLLLAGRFLAPPRNRVRGKNVLPLLYTLATILAFLLLNIEIADFFAQGNYLRFEFSGNFARDMTYSIAWGLFALALLLIGIRKQLAPVRYASLGLLGVTLLKLFLHDLNQLAQLYRIGAFVGVAIILILASWFYQRFLAASARNAPPPSS